MNEFIYDFRYPYNSLFEFWTGGYFLKVEALHLDFAYLCYVFFVFNLFSDKRISPTLKCSIVFFGGAVFNNFAFLLAGIALSDYFGIFAMLLYLLSGNIKENPILSYLMTFFCIALIHLLFVSVVNDVVLETLSVKRFLVVLKILVLASNVAILIGFLKNERQFKYVISKLIVFFNIVAIAYFIQVIVFILGFLPYGSFSPAGWSESPLPSFASTSIERGHLGKFFVPLFPLYFFALKKYNYKKSFYLFMSIAFLNLSASSYMFLMFYLCCVLFLFVREAKNIIVLGSVFVIIIFFSFYEQIIGLFLKVYELAFMQDETGGRSFSLLLPVLEKFDYLGYGYGGSTFRNLHHIEGLDLNNSIVAFWGQLSFFGVGILIAFIIMLFRVVRQVKHASDKLTKKILFMSLLGICLIFAADILYFVPTVWLPVAILYTFLIHDYSKVIQV